MAVNTQFLRVQLMASLAHHSVNKHKKMHGLTPEGLKSYGLEMATSSITLFVAVTVKPLQWLKPGEGSILISNTVIANTGNACEIHTL